MRHVGRCVDIYSNDVSVFVASDERDPECPHCAEGNCEQAVFEWTAHEVRLVAHGEPYKTMMTPARMLAEAWIAHGLPMPQKATAMVELN
jgi:hypothetical protein